MKVIDPAVTDHQITLIPRYYPTLACVVSLYNEASKQTDTPTNSYLIEDGEMKVSFTYTFTNKEKYQIKITEGTEVVYRGKIWVTDQEPQEFKLTDGVYTYEG